MPRDDPADVWGIGTQCDANPDLLRALVHRVGEHAVNADHGERQGDGGEDAHQRNTKALLRDFPLHHVVQALWFVYHELGIDRGQLLPRDVEDIFSVRGRRHDLGKRPIAVVSELRMGQVHLPHEITPRCVRHVAYHADHLPAQPPAHADLPAEGIPIAECVLGGRLVDDRHEPRIGPVAVGEVTSRHEADPQRAEVIPLYHAHLDRFALDLAIGVLPPVTPRVIGPRGREFGNRGSRTHPRDGPQPLVELLVEAHPPLGLVVPPGRQVDLERRHVLRIDSQIDALQHGEAFHEDASPDEQNQGERDLTRHQRSAHVTTPHGARRASGPVSYGAIQVHLGELDRGRESEHHGGHQRHRAGERQQHGVERHRVSSGQRRGTHGQQRLDAPKGERQAGHSAERREDKTFRQKLHDEAAASRAQRRADRELLLSGDAAREKQIGDIHTCNQ